MSRWIHFRLVLCCLTGMALVTSGNDETQPKAATPTDKAEAIAKDVTQGALRIVAEDLAVVDCPLEHTAVDVNISGFIARVNVKQTFRNPSKEKIEAVYVFPLPHEAAVDDMTMVVGDQRIVGMIRRRQEARNIYQQALRSGQTAALLEQERPNIFTQSVGNIQPGQQVDIEISYVDVLKYDMGTYEFHYPMVVGPRYNPQSSFGQPAVSDAATINPPVLKPDQRTGHDVSLTVTLDAGVPIQNLNSANHKVHTIRKGDRRARVRLLQEDSIPNRDFMLRYEVVGKKPEMAVLAHTGEFTGDARRVGNGYFMLMIQPKEDERLKQSPPREVVFLVDVSGSMRGAPTERTREAMKHMLELCREQDTFQVVTFASRSEQLFEKPVPVNASNIERAVGYTRGMRGSGGTEMLKGVKMAIDQPIDKQRIRIIVMLTDGFIGNEAQIIKHVGSNCGDQIRFWAIGMGQSPNMFLIDGVAKQGGGMGKKLGLNDNTVALTQEVMTRIQRAQLAKIKIDWNGLNVFETFPAKLPELWAGRPVIVFGRYSGGGESQVTMNGTVEGEDVSWPLEVRLPAQQKDHDVLAKIWARQKIEDLMHHTYYQDSPAVEEEVTAIALNHRLMSQYTSFVAVDPKTAAGIQQPARPPRRMMVPVPLPEGTEWEGFFGEGGGFGGGGFAAHERNEEVFSPFFLFQAGRAGSGQNRAPSETTLKMMVTPRILIQQKSLQERIASYEEAYRMQTQVAGRALALGGLGIRQNDLARRYAGFDHGRQPFGGQEAVPLLAKVPYTNRLFRGFGDSAGTVRSLGELSDDINGNGVLANPHYAWAAVSPQVAKRGEIAHAAFTEAKQSRDKKEAAVARSMFARAYLLDVSAVRVGQSNGQIASQALTALDELHDSEVKQYVKANRSLGKILDLVIRDKWLEHALAEVAEAAGLNISVTPGSVADAKSLLVGSDTRVSYLDLRGATVVQALDWIVQPVRMQWTLAGDSVVVSTVRRADGKTTWVYDVSTIALPSSDELKDIKDYNKGVAAAKKHADDFLNAVRRALELDEDSALWYAPGQLLIYGDRQVHAKASSLLANLANAQFKPADDLLELHQVTAQRANDRSEPLARLRAARHRMQLAASHDEFGWQLLSAAAAGRLDLEALTQLRIAWENPVTSEVLSGKGASLGLRSLWMVCEASRALPEEVELRQLADRALQKSRRAAEDTLNALKEKPDDDAAFVGLFYASLARMAGDETSQQFVKRALPLLAKARHEKSPFAALPLVAQVLLDSPTASTDQALVELVDAGVSGEDIVALLALACRRTGNDAWDAFRAKSRQLVGEQPLRGHVVLLVDRLAKPQLPLAVAREY